MLTNNMKDTLTEMPPIAAIDGGKYAFFFDVDGTLAEICAEPDAVSIPASVRDNLKALSDACSGALALVSGRPVEQLDELAAPLILPAAGVHGAEVRDAAGHFHQVTLSDGVEAALQTLLEQGISAMPGTLLEAKGMAFALHYRQAPAFQEQVLKLAESAIAAFPEMVLQPGKCVVEIKPRGINKGEAINRFMQQAPFRGRLPVFVGDDLTDEKGFDAVNAMQGISVKVGEGSSQARFRLTRVSDVHHWLEQLQRHITLSKTNKKESML